MIEVMRIREFTVELLAKARNEGWTLMGMTADHGIYQAWFERRVGEEKEKKNDERAAEPSGATRVRVGDPRTRSPRRG